MYRILVVDDEKSIRITFKVFLEKEGYEVITAENVDMAESQLMSEEVDLIISDIIMPKSTGIDLLNKYNKIDPDLPIIIMTGEPTVETATLAIKGNAYDYIIKPVNKELLLKSAKNALAYKKINDDKKRLEKENLLYREHLHELVEVRTKALQDAMNSTISTIASIVEMRDPYTAGHERRVGNLAVAIAKKLNLPKASIDCVYVAGYLHDLGKISVPAEILAKPGKLTDLEYGIIKEHVRYGYQLLKKITLPWPVADVVYQHHERINGSGYPSGLKGDMLSTEAKVIAVADVIEAMTSHRPYRPSIGMEGALNEIKKNRGVLYDEDTVDAAVELLEIEGYQLDEQEMYIELEM